MPPSLDETNKKNLAFDPRLTLSDYCVGDLGGRTFWSFKRRTSFR